MKPYYERDGVTIYHGDCREFDALVDVIIGDPPYDERTHAGARSLGLDARTSIVDGRRHIADVGKIDIAFDPVDVTFAAELWRRAQRWCVLFCSVEMLGRYRDIAGDAYIRGGFWRRPDGAPQISGDRPAQPGEGIAILHRTGKKSWNGHGRHAYFEHCIVKRHRVHPTQKPLSLMIELVGLFSNRGETVLDPFMGSGTTLVAAKRARRRAIGVEIDEAHCESAARRLDDEQVPLDFGSIEHEAVDGGSLFDVVAQPSVDD